MPTPRKNQICLEATRYYHCISRCVRKAYLCGTDSTTNRCYNHRRQWVENRILYLAQIFSIDVCAYAVMSNHCHIVLRVDVEHAKSLSDREVINRWHKLCKGTMVTKQFEKTGEVEGYLEQTLKETVNVYRKRLFDISWFMRLLNEPIARMANAEDECTGRFWEGRFKCQALLDDAALAACMAYVDLNPIRAGLAVKPEDSAYTSLKQRVEAATLCKQPQTLLPLKCDSVKSEPEMSFSVEDYFQLVALTGQSIRENNSGPISNQAIVILARLNISPHNWLSLTTKFEYYFKGCVGQSSSLAKYCMASNKNRRSNLSNCRKLFR
ncbi:transposase [Thalassotalea sp. PS06]|uniref:transposase n=1 Tax=Thalassotalea sp. PS06 TaxID=2594005 RepID=UPI0011651453|nr:transposase [Thalassotalea sp. PS06]QDP00519.1 transposase [Thalassotalea sp. PS06]